jgi:hypothetical protein
MIDRIFWLHSKLSKDQCVRIVLTRENWEVTIDKTDVLKSDDGQLTILRANGNITVINPEYVIMICTMRKGVIL